MSAASEKRRVQRVALAQPIDGWLNKHPVRIVDVSTTGARVEHTGPFAGRREVDLRFVAHGIEFSLRSQLVRSRLQKSAHDSAAIVYSTGLRFTDPTEESRVGIRRLVARLVTERASGENSNAGPLSIAV